ncbi:MAG: ATP-binding cassette domain-containing protein, partial [Amylibacter sp.]|nr:ATP-binding cassette domain-containing protein [Amylibacter sp.]
MLEINNIQVAHGRVQALFGVSLTAHPGEILCLLGRNGAGKTTTLKSIMGLLPLTSGTITFEGQNIDTLPAHEIPARRIGYIPQGRR